LTTGRDLLSYFPQRLSDEELREKLREPWKIHGARVTRDFRRRRPGQRPVCWWWYSAPEPRPIAPDPDGVRWLSWEERDLFQNLLDLSVLVKHGLVTVEEQAVLDRQAAETKRMALKMIKDRAAEEPKDPSVN
jgi:hypothetical protein